MAAHVVSWQRRGDRVPAAALVTSVEVLGALGDEPGIPFAVWVKHHDQVDRAAAAGATLLLTAKPDLVERGAVLVPPVGLEVDRWPAVAPLVRRRRREAAGLPDVHVIKVDELDTPEAEQELALASAAVVSGPATLRALALGTPIVTSADTARRLGLRQGRDAEVAANPDAALALAEEVAADEGGAASLSRRPRRCAEHHRALGGRAGWVGQALGLARAPTGFEARIDERLTELGTPAGSPTRVRVADALAVLTADGGGSSA